jgi:ferric-dicitrate binding protein FerR (iron transport regulator)
MSTEEDMSTGDVNQDGRADGEEEVGRLLKIAGARAAAPVGAEARVHAVVLAHWRAAAAAHRRRRTIFGTAGLVAAAAVLLIVVMPLLRHRGAGSGAGGTSIATLLRVEGSLRTTPVLEGIEPGAAIPEGTEVETGPGDRAALLLSDGTALRIDRETRMRLLAGPLVDLQRGAIYAETKEPATGPRALRIRTSLGMVRDVGTRFEVRLAGSVLQVSVRAGVARLERGSEAHEAGAGTQLVAEQGGDVAVRSRPVYGADWDWTQTVAPEFAIEGRPLGEFLAWAAQETGLRVRFADPAIEPHAVATVLHGSVRGMRPDEALGAVLPTCGLRHSVQDDALVISR